MGVLATCRSQGLLGTGRRSDGEPGEMSTNMMRILLFNQQGSLNCLFCWGSNNANVWQFEGFPLNSAVFRLVMNNHALSLPREETVDMNRIWG